MFWWIVKIALWALAGFTASQIMKTTLSLGTNVLLGLLGGLLGTWIGKIVGIRSVNSLGGILSSVAGACLLIYVARKLLPMIKGK